MCVCVRVCASVSVWALPEKTGQPKTYTFWSTIELVFHKKFQVHELRECDWVVLCLGGFISFAFCWLCICSSLSGVGEKAAGKRDKSGAPVLSV